MKMDARQQSINFTAGIIAGVSVAGVFNPFDKALYLSLTQRRPFLDRQNFAHPYQGFFQSVIHRTLTSGLYFPLYDAALPIAEGLYGKDNKLLNSFIAGNLAGCMNGVFLNPLSAVKYQSWGKEEPFGVTARRMWRSGSFRAFFNGSWATICRDSSFGGTFAVCKYYFPIAYVEFMHPVGSKPSKTVETIGAILAGGLATIISSPYNYARNMKYASNPSNASESMLQIFANLYRTVRSQPRPVFYLLKRMQVGWGTLRVAFGMATNAVVYDILKAAFTTAMAKPVEKRDPPF